MTKYSTPKPTSAKNAPGAPLKKYLGVRRLPRQTSNGFGRQLFPTTPKKHPQPTISSLDKERLQTRKECQKIARAGRSLKY